ncbi:MAG TPA: SDR family NAD(P)-dependent oxidoreductase [Acidimicrobiales bacterium]|nr:SDR family NAD(P)-dependent oxidoreductase [Acidimicrobiales bacterium]
MERGTVLTTGANSGIGLATVVELAKVGFHSVGSVRSQEKSDVVIKAAADAGVAGKVDTIILDVTDADACASVIESLPPLSGLVNNAGFGLTGAVEDVSDDEAHLLFETMVHAPVRLARLAIPEMVRNGGGRIVNVSSIAGRTTSPLAGHYTAAKHALEALSDALRIEVASRGVHVALVEPGGFKTNIWDDMERDIANREQAGSRFIAAYRRSMSGQRVLERLMGDPTQCARTIATALTTRLPRARYLVGADARALLLADTLTPTPIKDFFLRRGLDL